MKIKILRCGVKEKLFSPISTCSATPVLKEYGFARLAACDIDNLENCGLSGDEYHRLIIRGKDNAIWRVNGWLYQDCLEIEIIGFIQEDRMTIDREAMIGDYDDLLKKLDRYIAAVAKFRRELPDARELLPEGNEDTSGYYFHYFDITSFISVLEESAKYAGLEL